MGESEATREVRRRHGIPDGIALRADAREILAFLPAYAVAVREVAAHPDDLPPSGRGGRTRLARLEAPGGPVLVREVRKGGYFRRWRGPRLAGSARPLEELVLHRRLAALGVPVTEAVGCVVLRRPVGWRGFLLVREEPGAVDGEAWLHGVPSPGRAPRRETLRNAGRAVRALHDAGVAHPDLHPKNMLLLPDDRILLLDFDKAGPEEGVLGDRARLVNLTRLGRAIVKHRLKGLVLGPRDMLRFLAGYAGSAKAARLWLERIDGRLGRGLALRRAWWRLMGQARPWRPASGTPA